MGSTGCSTSAAKVSIKTGVKDPGTKLIVEGGKRISFEEIKRDVERGVAWYNAHHSAKWRIH